MGYIDDIVKSTGQKKATLKKVDSSQVNKWGDATREEVEEETISAVFELISEEVEEVVEGDYEAGDLKAYIPTYVEIFEDDVLVYQGSEYVVDEVMEMRIGNEGHYEVRARQS